MASHLQRTPPTQTATERAEQLARDGKVPATNPAPVPPAPPLTPAEIRARLNGTSTAEQRRAAISRTLVPEQVRSAGTPLRPDEDYDGSTMSLPPSRIVAYDRNPRRAANAAYAEIKDSIRVKGVTNIFSVTRRPGSTEYMVYGGGNTRLKILQELALEQPENPLFRTVTVVYRAWKSEADTFTAHLIENEARADTTFWDKASGLVSLKKELEASEKRILSANDIRAHASALGWRINRDNTLLYTFAVKYLSEIGPWLTASGAREIRSNLNLLIQMVERYPGADENQLINAIAPGLSELAIALSALFPQRTPKTLTHRMWTWLRRQTPCSMAGRRNFLVRLRSLCAACSQCCRTPRRVVNGAVCRGQTRATGEARSAGRRHQRRRRWWRAAGSAHADARRRSDIARRCAPKRRHPNGG